MYRSLEEEEGKKGNQVFNLTMSVSEESGVTGVAV